MRRPSEEGQGGRGSSRSSSRARGVESVLFSFQLRLGYARVGDKIRCGRVGDEPL
jgi:hypothetical protein